MNSYGILIHHGILGMKWGIRRYQNKDGSLTKAGRERYQIGNGQLPVKRNLIYNLFHAKEAKMTKEYYKNIIDGVNYNPRQNSISELNKKDSGVSNDILEDMKTVNKTGELGYTQNCVHCVCALEMRQRGYDVDAMPKKDGTMSEQYDKFFKNVQKRVSYTPEPMEYWKKENFEKWTRDGYNKISSDISKEGPNARGYVSFVYNGWMTGHTVMWATDKNGKVTYYDGQSGSTEDPKRAMSLSTQYYEYARLDNLEVNDLITSVVKNRR